MSDPLPEPWRTALEPKGVSSKRGLATKAGISPQTAKRLIDGIGAPSIATVNAVADALFNGDRDRVWLLAGRPRRVGEPFELPDEAALLTTEQQAAIVALIRSIVNVQPVVLSAREHQLLQQRGSGVERRFEDVYASQEQARDAARQRAKGNDPRLEAVRNDSVGEENQDPGSEDPA